MVDKEKDLGKDQVRKIAPGSLLEIMSRAVDTEYTGRMIFRRGSRSCALFFQSGYVVYARTNNHDHRIGDILMRSKGLSEEDVQEAVKKSKARKMPLGMHLLSEKVIDASDLYQGLVTQVELVIKGVVGWDSGVCFLHAGVGPGEDVVLLKVSPRKVLGDLSGPEKPVETPAEPVEKVEIPETPEDLEKLEAVLHFLDEKEAHSDDDCYGLLGVKPGASQEEVESAYHALMRKWHPDLVTHLLPGEDSSRLQAVFTRLNAAYEVLGDEKKRKELETLEVKRVGHGERKGAGEERASAAQLYRRGRQAMDEENHRQAVESFEKAIRLDPVEAKYFYYLGAAHFKGSGNLQKAEEALRKAIELDSSQADYYYSLGLVYKAGNLNTRALKMFDKALAWEPYHRKALREKKGLEKPETKKKRFMGLWPPRK